MDCIFCSIIAKEIPAKTIKETTHSVSFMDAFPLVKGHVLVVPKEHHEKIQDMTSEQNNDLFSLVHDILPKVDSLTGATLIAVHNGKDAGQEIPHVHVHLVPRNKIDSAGPIHSMFDSQLNLSEKEFDDVYNKLKTLD